MKINILGVNKNFNGIKKIMNITSIKQFVNFAPLTIDWFNLTLDKLLKLKSVFAKFVKDKFALERSQLINKESI